MKGRRKTKLQLLIESDVYPVGTRVKITSPSSIHPRGVENKVGKVVKLHIHGGRPAMQVKIGNQIISGLRKSNVSLVGSEGATKWSKSEVNNVIKGLKVKMRDDPNPKHWGGKVRGVLQDLAPTEFKNYEKAYSNFVKSWNSLIDKLRSKRDKLI